MFYRITLIHAVTIAIGPIETAFKRLWPEAQTYNLLDDSLSQDLEREGEITPALKERFLRLGEYGIDSGADALLFTCSAFGGAIDYVKEHLAKEHRKLPVLKPNEAMLDDALTAGLRLALVATFEPALTSMKPELEAAAAARGVDLTVRTVYVAGALEALRLGKLQEHDALIADATTSLEHFDAVLLAQFSMARAAPKVRERSSVQVFTSPESAVLRLKAALLR